MSNQNDNLTFQLKIKIDLYMYWDSLRWRIELLVFVIGGIVISIHELVGNAFGPLLLLYSLFTACCVFLLLRLRDRIQGNTREIQQITQKLGGHLFSDPRKPIVSAAYWFIVFAGLCSLGSFCASMYFLPQAF